MTKGCLFDWDAFVDVQMTFSHHKLCYVNVLIFRKMCIFAFRKLKRIH